MKMKGHLQGNRILLSFQINKWVDMLRNRNPQSDRQMDGNRKKGDTSNLKVRTAQLKWINEQQTVSISKYIFCGEELYEKVGKIRDYMNMIVSGGGSFALGYY